MKRDWLISVVVMAAISAALGCGGSGGLNTTGSGGSGSGGMGTGGMPDTTFDGPPTCQSGSYYVGQEGTDMRPGEACIACHTQNQQGFHPPPLFTFAGTVFAEGHAQNHCVASADEQAELEQAQVVITGADNAQLTLPLKTAQGFQNGNFSTTKAIKLPYTAKVVYMGKERAMTTPQQTGDCNSCHTVTGANGAPGRITLPQ